MYVYIRKYFACDIRHFNSFPTKRLVSLFVKTLLPPSRRFGAWLTFLSKRCTVFLSQRNSYHGIYTRCAGNTCCVGLARGRSSFDKYPCSRNVVGTCICLFLIWGSLLNRSAGVFSSDNSAPIIARRAEIIKKTTEAVERPDISMRVTNTSI